MASTIDWTEETIARLRAFWRAGHSTAEIGRRMGTSKNAVVGKAHRLELPPRPSPIRRDGSGPPCRQATPRVRKASLPPLPSVASAGPPLATRPPPAPPLPVVPRPLVMASCPPARQPCCWPIGHPGKPGFRFCDAAAMPRKPYCAEHAGLAYVEPEAAAARTAATSTRRGGAT